VEGKSQNQGHDRQNNRGAPRSHRDPPSPNGLLPLPLLLSEQSFVLCSQSLCFPQLFVTLLPRAQIHRQLGGASKPSLRISGEASLQIIS
jgi:hypothetical protein